MQVLRGQRRRTLVCSFCGKQQDLVQRVVAGPGNVYICDECVAAFSKELEETQQESGLRCSFCGKKQGQVRHLTIGAHGVNICNECIALCQEIIDEEHS